MDYVDQLAHPKWQKKRLEILERDKFTCQICSDTETTLHIHHKEYDPERKKLAWQYPDHIYITLCSFCHKELTEHKKKYGTETGFDVLRIKRKGSEDAIFIYSNGTLRRDFYNNVGFMLITEDSLKKLIHFVINNWLKNG